MKRLIYMLLSLMGFNCVTGCTEMYGPLYPDEFMERYRANGCVVNDEDKPIAGISVRLGEEVVYTDETGRFSIVSYTDNIIYFEDVDGVENGGEYREYSAILTEEYINLGNVKLQRKDNNLESNE